MILVIIVYTPAESANVTLTIYVVDGTVVRTLKLGHQPIGIYQEKDRVAYWDAKNAQGKPAASGVYFYTITAGDFTLLANYSLEGKLVGNTKNRKGGEDCILFFLFT